MYKNIEIPFAKVNDWCIERVVRYGAQYRVFGIFGLINYPLSYIYNIFIVDFSKTYNLTLIVIPTLLCLGLFLKDKWPETWKNFLPLYWYFSVMVCLPFTTTYFLLQNQISLVGLIKYMIGTLIGFLALDWLMCIIVYVLGSILAITTYLAIGNRFDYIVPYENTELFIYMVGCVFGFGLIFLRNRELAYESLLQEKMDKLNKQLQKDVDQRTEALQEQLEDKTRFVNNVSHEIKTPVHGLVTVSTFLIDNWEQCSESDRLKWSKMICNSARRLSGLIINILDLARFNLGKISVEPEKTDLVYLVKEMIDECLTLYVGDSSRKINFQFDYTGVTEAVIEADSLRITQVLRNLYANAMRYSDQLSETTIVAQLKHTNIIYTDGSSEYAHFFSITDQGVGIPEDYLEKIFDVFVESSRTVGKSGGTGLGLAICKEIIEAHCGMIWAENNPERIGSRFSFIIPAKFLGIRIPKISMLTTAQVSKIDVFNSNGSKDLLSKQVLSFRDNDL